MGSLGINKNRTIFYRMFMNFRKQNNWKVTVTQWFRDQRRRKRSFERNRVIFFHFKLQSLN